MTTNREIANDKNLLPFFEVTLILPNGTIITGALEIHLLAYY
ncbi:hypothetical protein ALNOE001_19060 [Candidatus Methanobinarius endosymbioticus]|uniref:Uncharacterized protein n=1 Tax=Candidatus Methanobinarius endosymbioticus TaxID=2006182 RepID=A0A366M8L1_9EURY|nr:hypothetical protein ALNOE001_19060 [Candidatus Methanobinarius endosymbioticus]